MCSFTATETKLAKLALILLMNAAILAVIIVIYWLVDVGVHLFGNTDVIAYNHLG